MRRQRGAAASAAHERRGHRREARGETADASCHLGNGVKHVVTLMFDNVHYFRDNPNVPSDLQQMPNLLNFFTATARSCPTTTRRSSRTPPMTS